MLEIKFRILRFDRKVVSFYLNCFKWRVVSFRNGFKPKCCVYSEKLFWVLYIRDQPAHHLMNLFWSSLFSFYPTTILLSAMYLVILRKTWHSRLLPIAQCEDTSWDLWIVSWSGIRLSVPTRRQYRTSQSSLTGYVLYQTTIIPLICINMIGFFYRFMHSLSGY